AAKRLGVIGRQGVADPVGQLDHRLGAQATVEVIVEGDFGQLEDGVVGGDAGGYIHHRFSLSDDIADRLSAGGGNRPELAIGRRRAPAGVQSRSGSISPLLIRSRRSVMTRPASETRERKPSSATIRTPPLSRVP